MPNYIGDFACLADRFKNVRLCVPFLGYPLYQPDQLYSPFFIIGSGRSGSTLLRRILFNHPQIHIPPETLVLPYVIKIFNRYGNMAWKDLIYFVLSQFEFNSQFKYFEITLASLANDLTKVEKKHRSLAFILNQFYLYHASSVGVNCTMWGDKTPLNTFYLDRLKSVFPNAKFIHIVRDGCDVVSSYVRENLYSDIKSAAIRWKDSVIAAEKFISKNKEKSIEIRYEQLVCDPEAQIIRLCEFLSVNYTSRLIQDLERVQKMGDAAHLVHHKAVNQPINPNQVGKGRAQFSVSEKQVLTKLIGKKLVDLGYDPVMNLNGFKSRG